MRTAPFAALTDGASQDPDAPIDYWREVARRGVLALGFSIRRFGGEHWMAAELVGPLDGPVRRSAHAAIEIDKAIGLEAGPASAVRSALADRLEAGAAARELAAYQAVLLERLWHAIGEAPAQRLDSLAHPHDD